jgi:hypothetical protein
MTSRDTILGIGSIVGYFSLLIGVLGQAAFMSPVTKPHLPAIIAVMIFLLPWLIVFTITYTKQSFLPPRPYRFCLLFAMCWFAAVTIFAEILYHLGYMPPDSPSYAGTLSRVLMHIGWLSLLFIIPRYIAIGHYESKRDA